MVRRKHFRAAVGDLHDVLDTAAAKAGIVETGFDRDDGAFGQNVGRSVDARGLVNRHAQAVAGAVEKSDGAVLATFGFVTGGIEDRGDFAVNFTAVYAGANGFDG